MDFRTYLNLADARLGARVVSVTDDWFAAADRMLQPHEPEWKEGVYDDNGKWMDGWESRRKRFEGYDSAVVRLGVAGSIRAIELDTRHFTGNYPPSASVEGCMIEEGEPGESAEWSEVLPAVALSGNSVQLHPVSDPRPWTHLRLNIYPDGGIARFRVWGVPYIDWKRRPAGEVIDLASALNGGRALACSDEHYGRMGNLLNPGRGSDMGDGWETARRRSPGYDWVIVALGHPGVVERIVVDTNHFKGNFPDSCSIVGGYVRGGAEAHIESQSLYWRELLPSRKLSMHQEHVFVDEVLPLGAITHVRLNIFPDGGVSRLRLFGRIAR